MSLLRRAAVLGLSVMPLIGCMDSSRLPASDAVASVRIQHLDSGEFAVELSRSAALGEWLFVRTPGIDLRERWRWLSDGARFEKRGRRDVVVLPEPSRTLRFVVPADDRFVQADYSLTQTFAKHAGTVLYVGHFSADEEVPCPDSLNAKPPCPAQRPIQYELVPRSGEHVWLDSQISTGATTWLDTDNDGTMAYFGNVQPEVVGDSQILLDPNLPAWMREELPVFMAALVERYTRGYGRALDFTPRLLFSFGGGHPRRTSLYGGVVDRMVALSVLGDLWLEPTAQARQRYLYLIAHEASHLWNGGQFQHDHSTGASWLHEGNADAAARAAGFALGLFDEATLWTARTQALGTCLRDVTEPLNEAGQRGNFSLYYACGEMIELLVEGAARRVGEDALAHWRVLFEQIPDGENEYDQTAYLEAVVAVTGDDNLAAFIQRWADQGLADSDALFEQLEKAGVLLGSMTDDNVGRAQFSALMHVLQLDCPDGFSLSHRPDSVQVRGGGSCVLLPDKWLEIESIAGVPITGSESAVVEVISNACARLDGLPLAGWLRNDHDVASEQPPERVRVEIPIRCHRPFRFVELQGWVL